MEYPKPWLSYFKLPGNAPGTGSESAMTMVLQVPNASTG